MLLLKVISRLLDYPTAALFSAADELVDLVDNSPELNSDERLAISAFVRDLTGRDLYDAQERYDLLFDRGRALSLLLFEHVHGESRDRGQAMVELIGVYESRGFAVVSEQLPDYIPLYLEFLSEQDVGFAREWLGDIGHLLAMLSERLLQRDCNYSILFDALISISGYDVIREEIAEMVGKEERDDTMEAIDKEWEDKEVRFDEPAGEPCVGTGAGSVSGQVLSEQIISPHVPVKQAAAK